MGVFGADEDTHFELVYSRGFGCKISAGKFRESMFLRSEYLCPTCRLGRNGVFL